MQGNNMQMQVRRIVELVQQDWKPVDPTIPWKLEKNGQMIIIHADGSLRYL